MVTLLDLWLPILLSTLAVFILSFLVWTALPHHKSDFKKLPDEDGVINAMRGRPPEPGAYMLPRAWTHAEVRNPEIAQKLTQGPVGFITIVPSGMPTMGKKFVQLFIFYLVVSVLVAYVTGTAFAAGQAGWMCSGSRPRWRRWVMALGSSRRRCISEHRGAIRGDT